jgi:hypothetical protein
LKNALDNLERSPSKTILGGDVKIWRNSLEKYTALEAYESVFAYRFQMYIEKHNFSGTGNLVVRRSDFLEIGPFAGIELAEDIDWGRRACSAGFKLQFMPNMIVYHPARKTSKELFAKWDRHIQHALNSSQARRGWQIHWTAKAFAILASPVIDWIHIAQSNRISGFPARLKGFFVLVAVRAYRFASMMMLLFAAKDVPWNRGNSISRTGATLGPRGS